jgi:hypothetical protein
MLPACRSIEVDKEMTTKAIITKHDSGAIEVAVGNELYVFTDQELSFAKRRGESVKRNRKLADRLITEKGGLWLLLSAINQA